MKHFTHLLGRLLSIVALLFVVTGNVVADDETPIYNLTFGKLSSGTNYNTYTAPHDVTCDDITWTVFGNQSVGEYLRVGGQTTTATERTLTAKSGMSSAVSRVILSHQGITNGKNTTLVIDELKLIVSSDNSFSENSILEEVSIIASDLADVGESGSFTFSPSAGSDWTTGAFYKIVFKSHVTGDKKNSGLNISSVAFYKDESQVSGTHCTISLDSDSDNCSAEDVEVNEGITNAQFPITVADGYVLYSNGILVDPELNFTWNPTTGILTFTDAINSDVTVTAVATELPKYTVTFDAQGGICDVTSITETTGGAGIVLPAALIGEEYTGWSFAGWAAASVAQTNEAPAFVGVAGDTYHPTESTTLYAVYKKVAETGQTVEPAVLTNAEIMATEGISSGSYQSTYTIKSKSGDWTGRFAIQNVNNNNNGTGHGIMINKNKNNYHLTSPLFTNGVASLTIKTDIGSHSNYVTKANTSFYICSSNETARPTSGDLGSVTLQSDEEEVTVNLEGAPKQFHIYSSGTAYISEITINFVGVTSVTTYNSNPNLEVKVTLDEHGVSTLYYGNANLMFVDEGLAGYIYSYEAGELTAMQAFSEATDDYCTIPAGVGVLLYGTPNTTYTFEVVDEDMMDCTAKKINEDLGNVLTGDDVKHTKNNGKKHFVLAETAANGLGFYRVSDAFEFTAHKAYLELDAEQASNVRSFSLGIEGLETAIGRVEAAKGESAIYSISGQRVSKAVKGLYIVNGKKVVVK